MKLLLVQILVMVAIARKCQESFFFKTLLALKTEVILTASKLQLLKLMLTSFQNANNSLKEYSQFLKILTAHEYTLTGCDALDLCSVLYMHN